MDKLFIAFFCLWLASCAKEPHPNAGRYKIEQDIAPERAPLEQELFDPTPVYEEPTRGGNSDYRLLGKDYKVLKSADGFSEEGIASWYGKKFHGHLTSNGETYDMYEMTAAHKTLPLPTYVKVTNLENGRQAIVRVNDRGPFHAGRIIDLSYAAAFKLGVYQTGTARVKIESLHSAAGYYIQVAKGKDAENMQEKSMAIAALFQVPTKILQRDGIFWLVAGPMDELTQADKVIQDLLDYGYPDARHLNKVEAVGATIQ
ncbi:septal ring lytic transglycosylase RlpA family protein [Gayadomonas joobiniege]|uniref:septal ring lytic transglycosylase RlpA family protein n=1 Tax=Gayadomonas joobiniege TaxID=1234606 RepID=UPI00037AC16D|nr:septal ring lytic transglycosylase RlpA family protein [Gayadomonas joobiniege]